MSRNRLYHCIVCNTEKSRKKFDAAGRGRHICKDCYALPKEVRSEALRVDKLHWLIPKYPKSRDDWALIEQYASHHKDKESGQIALQYLEENSSHYRAKKEKKERKQNTIHRNTNRNIAKKLLEQIEATYAVFKENAELQVTKGNKAAGVRSRKTSLEIRELLKEFRKVSIQATQKK